ncbi:MAG: OadG family protein [Firmicutes bacterium]|nr:OadG family protein [Bacillota bacterium]
MLNIGKLLLDANADGAEELATVGEKATTALQVFLLGLGTVFVVLIILYIVITLMGKIFYHDDKKKATKEAAPEPAAEAAALENAVPEQETDDGELVAVITAAIAAFSEAGGGESVPGFRVVSFKRASTATPWNRNFR